MSITITTGVRRETETKTLHCNLKRTKTRAKHLDDRIYLVTFVFIGEGCMQDWYFALLSGKCFEQARKFYVFTIYHPLLLPITHTHGLETQYMKLQLQPWICVCVFIYIKTKCKQMGVVLAENKQVFPVDICSYWTKQKWEKRKKVLMKTVANRKAKYRMQRSLRSK